MKTEGVIVNSLPFQDNDCILSLFTPNEGLIKLFSKGAYNNKKRSAPSPLMIVEAVYTKGRSELFRCQEITPINSLINLRNDLATLQAGCDMLQAISLTQHPEKPAPELYQLLLAYLYKLPLTTSPTTISTSFRLKLLRYEGLLGMLSHCSVCATPLRHVWIQEGEAFCGLHANATTPSLLEGERHIIEILMFSRDFSQLAATVTPHLLVEKIKKLFEERIS